jgi:hypothetical protein
MAPIYIECEHYLTDSTGTLQNDNDNIFEYLF